MAVAVVMVVAILGRIEWNVSWAARGVSAAISRWSGWPVEFGQLWVTPWSGFRAQDVKLRPAGAGSLHMRHLMVDWRGVSRDGLISHWRANSIFLDPGPWKIRRPEAVALLSEGPALDTVHGTVSARPGGFQVHSLRIHGWAVRGHGAGRWAGGQARYWLRGRIASSLLESLGIRRTRGAWESCWFRVEGPVQRPVITFKSRVVSMTVGQK